MASPHGCVPSRHAGRKVLEALPKYENGGYVVLKTLRSGCLANIDCTSGASKLDQVLRDHDAVDSAGLRLSAPRYEASVLTHGIPPREERLHVDSGRRPLGRLSASDLVD